MQTTKFCYRCKLDKLAIEFPKAKDRKDGLYCYCKKCNAEVYAKKSAENPGKFKAISKEYRRTHPDSMRKSDLKRNYGMTIEQYNQMFVSQNGSCLICGKQNLTNKHLNVDHNHQTGKVRGLLCQFCNTGLGNFKDEKELLLKAFKYLNKYDGKN